MSKFAVYLTYEYIVDAEDEDDALDVVEYQAPSGWMDADVERVS